MVDLNGAGVIVTGGASGLGEGTVRRLAAAGANVVIADLNEERGKEIAAELGRGTEFVRADVTSEEEVQEVVRVASSRGPLRVAVNCGGKAGKGGRTVGRDGSPASQEGFEFTVATFLCGTFNVSRLAAAQMAKEEPNEDGERGAIVMTSSIAGYEGQIGQAAYSAAKGGIIGLTLPLARDLSAIGVRVVTIAPGTFRTPAYSMMPEEMVQHLESLTPFPKRMGRPDEYAALVEHICTNAMLNGEVIRIDGATRFGPK
jgi:NAD(P)-dependent dehydrogenase (short-subunit alcohol dehydrogenase family)